MLTTNEQLLPPGSRKDFRNKVAVVTGSTSGIGLGIAEAFAEAGISVVLNGFGERDQIEETRLRLEKSFGVGVTYSPADMSKPAEIAQMMGEAKSAFGSVDILVNNAGIQHVEAIETFPSEKWDAIIAISLS